jgi:hypothetical protein
LRDQLIENLEKGDFQEIRTLCEHNQIRDLLEMRQYESNGKEEKYIKLAKKSRNIFSSNMTYDTRMWNPVHFAVYYGHTDSAKLFIDRIGTSLIFALRKPAPSEHYSSLIHASEDATFSPNSTETQMFCLEMAIINHDNDMFSYLWNGFNILWENRHLQRAIEMIVSESWTDGLKVILNSQTTRGIYRSLTSEDKDDLIFKSVYEQTSTQ